MRLGSCLGGGQQRGDSQELANCQTPKPPFPSRRPEDLNLSLPGRASPWHPLARPDTAIWSTPGEGGARRRSAPAGRARPGSPLAATLAGGAGAPGRGHLPSSFRGDIGCCRAVAPGGKSSRGKAWHRGELPLAARAQLPPRLHQRVDAACFGCASRKLCPAKSSARDTSEPPCAPRGPRTQRVIAGPPRVPPPRRPAARMRYADPSANRDLLGNRTLLFIFICAFALVTLLQQILYGRNYIKRGLQFGWQNGDPLANWTGFFNVTDDPAVAVQSGSDSNSRYFEFYEGPFEYNSTRCLELRHEILEVKVLSMVKQSELFDRWKSLQTCKWAMNISEANQFKSTLSRCCNAPAFLFTTQKNTPLGTKLKYEVETSGIYHINQEIFRMFPKDMPYYRSQFKKCAVVGNGGILKNSRCGKEINSADFVFRCNLPPISEKYTVDVGVKTDVVTVNPSIITERFHKLEKWRRPFYRVLQVYENASVLLPAFYNTRNTDVSIRVKYVLDDFESSQAVYYFHPQYLVNVSRYWLSLGVRAKRISTGLILVTAALELCEEVHLFGFWAFPMNPSGLYITHHYYDNVKPRPGFHAMPSEIFNFLHLHSRGILRVHTGICSCC